MASQSNPTDGLCVCVCVVMVVVVVGAMLKENNEERVFMSWRHLGNFWLVILINVDNEMGEIALATPIRNSSESCQFSRCDVVYTLLKFVKGTKYLRCNGLDYWHSGNR